jgi:hypothetical protein
VFRVDNLDDKCGGLLAHVAYWSTAAQINVRSNVSYWEISGTVARWSYSDAIDPKLTKIQTKRGIGPLCGVVRPLRSTAT